jgi:hypothetical protein
LTHVEKGKERPMIIRSRVAGAVTYNDGEFCEVEPYAFEGDFEDGRFLKVIQPDRSDFHEGPEEFKRRFPVGAQLEVVTTIEFRNVGSRSPKSQRVGKRSHKYRD